MIEQKFLLKDGRAAILRTPTEADAAQYLDLLKALAKETPFMLWTPEELNGFIPEYEAAFIRVMNDNPVAEPMVCEVDGVLVGEGRIIWDPRNRIRHRAQILFGIRKDFWSLGIARAMFEVMLRTADKNRITQLELEVNAENARAIRLYEKLGFQKTGSIPNALRQSDGSCHDIIYMVRSM